MPAGDHPPGTPRQAAKGPQAAENAGSNIRVAIRIRPFNSKEAQEAGTDHVAFEPDGNTVGLTKAGELEASRGGGLSKREFAFDNVFAATAKVEVTQERVFEEIGVIILENALNAYNGCLLAYGQTGAGKSHSMLGDFTNPQECGILPRACERLFHMVEQRRTELEAAGQKMVADLRASYLEIYQERMFDLLGHTRTDLQVRIHPTLGPHVPSLTENPVTNMQEVSELLDFGAKNRAVGATAMNATSSRSHAVFSIDLRLSISGGAKATDLQSKIRFVDLAGSERQKKTGATGERAQEGIAINQSLSALSRVIHALASKSKEMPPFRESKLTLLLKDALSGNSKTVLLACISPSLLNVVESISTLEFASRCKLVTTNAKKNEQAKRELVAGLTAEKEAVEQQLEAERQERTQLQSRLEEEQEQVRKAQELFEQMEKDKRNIEKELQMLSMQHSSTEKEREAELARLRAEYETKEKEWQKVQEESRRHSRELSSLKREQVEALERERAVCEEKERAQQEIERLAREKDEQLSQEKEDRKRVEEEMRRQHDEEKGRQTSELNDLREREAESRAREQAARAERERAKEELDRLEREKQEQLTKVEADRQRAVAELQEKLAEVKRREEEERLIARQKEARERELQAQIEKEVKIREKKEEALKQELENLQSLQNSWTLQKQDLEKHAQEQKGQRDQLMRELGIMGGSQDAEVLGKAPRLVNLHHDPMLEGCLIYYLQRGETCIGSDKEKCDICLVGFDIIGQVCVIVNEEDEKIIVRPSPNGNVYVNGAMVPEEGRALAHGDRVAIGWAHIFRAMIPLAPRAEGDNNRETEEEEFTEAMRELQDQAAADPRSKRCVDAAVLIVKSDFGTREANEFLESSRRGFDTIAEANATLRAVRRQCSDWVGEVSHYELSVLFEGDGPPKICVVARTEDQTRAGMWEIDQFIEERQPMMHMVQQALAMQFFGESNSEEEVRDLQVWINPSWGEIKVETFRTVSLRYNAVAQERERTQREAEALRIDERAADEEETGIASWLSGFFGASPSPPPSPDPHAAREEPVRDSRIDSRRSVAGAIWDVTTRSLGMSASGSAEEQKIVRVAAMAHNGVKLVQKAKRAKKKVQDDIGRHNAMRGAAALRSSVLGPSWPAASEDDFIPKIVPADSSSFLGNIEGESTQDEEGLPWQQENGAATELLDVVYESLFDGKLGLKLWTRQEGCFVRGFETDEVQLLGWQVWDEIIAINGYSISSREELKDAMGKVKSQCPVKCTVRRYLNLKKPSGRAASRKSARRDTPVLNSQPRGSSRSSIRQSLRPLDTE